MAEPQEKTLQSEQQALQKPLGLKRRWSWFVFFPIVLICLILPLAGIVAPQLKQTHQPQPLDASKLPLNAHPSLQSNAKATARHTTAFALDSVWNPGPLASAHAHLEGDCQACHAGDFSRIKNESCTSCHSNMGAHVDSTTLPETSFSEGRCASCHRDHKGRESLAEQNKHFVGTQCATCHANIVTVAPKTMTHAVSDFSNDQHPAFRITVATGSQPGDLNRLRMTTHTPLVEKSNLKFPHHLHLDPKGIDSPTKKVVMECKNCHEPADTRTGFKTLNMQNHCQQCHKLSFEPALPDRQVPHGPVDAVLSTVEEFYSYLALHPEESNRVNAQRAVLRARPGQHGESRSNLQKLSGNPRAQASFATVQLFENTACVVCHVVKATGGTGNKKTSGSRLPQYTIAALNPGHPWMPMSKFDHKAHAFQTCDSCHKASNSKTSSDVLMPGIASCQTCHAGKSEQPNWNKVESDCGVCHNYHVHNNTPVAHSINNQTSQKTNEPE